MNFAIGNVQVITNGQRGPEFYADRMVNQIIQISDTAPPELKQAAYHYKDAIRALLLANVREIMERD